MFKSLNKGISTPIAIIIIIVCALIVGGVMVWQYLETPGGEEEMTEIKPPGEEGEEEITNFEECVAAGYPILESYPRQCKTPDGRTFTGEIDETTDWKTYRNEKYGFEIDYPVDELDFSEDLSNVFSLCKEGYREWEINYISDAQMLGCIFGIILSLDSEYINYDWDREYIEDFYIKGSGISIVDTETKKIITDSGEIGQIRYGSAAISLGGELGGPIDFVVFPLKLKTKVLVLYSFGFELDETLNQILFTFRFLE